MKHLFIVNPAAGGRDRSREIAAAAERALATRREDFEIYTTRGPMDACARVEHEAGLCDTLRVYACGGDGTLNECACGAAGRENVAVTQFPCGTGNDFIRVFGAGAERFRSLEALLAGTARKMDLIDCNGRACLNICSVGIDARIGGDVHKYSALPLVGGAAGYVTSTAVNLLKGVNDPLRVICGDRLFYGEMCLVCACNGAWYGGGFHAVPEARPDDGVLDFLVVKGVSRLTFLRIVSHYAKGEYANYPRQITHLRGDSMEIRGEHPMSVNIDGEIMRAAHVRLRLRRAALNFIVPEGAGLPAQPVPTSETSGESSRERKQ